MACGNQRELVRQKNMKKTQEIAREKEKRIRKQRDSEIMQQKQKAANQKKSMHTREK
uniref:Small EDRK-rich factor-like N-terminal domain-containing protein n=1 Tax=Aotus nancymaae TaxID=37293 RepID=A0A2K5D761_AOTNA